MLAIQSDKFVACTVSLVVVLSFKEMYEACYKLVCLVNRIFDVATRVVYVIQILYYYSLLMCV